MKIRTGSTLVCCTKWNNHREKPILLPTWSTNDEPQDLFRPVYSITMLPDSFNPIFVLKTQRFFTFFQRSVGRILALSLVGSGFALVVFAFLMDNGFYIADAFLMFSMFTCFTSCVVAVIPGIDLAQKRIFDDLSLFTPLSDREVVRGYALSGLFYSCGIMLLGIPLQLFMLLVSRGELYDGWSLLCRIIFYQLLLSTVINFYVLAFFAGVRTSQQFWTTIMLFFVLYFPILFAFYIMGTEMHMYTYNLFSPYRNVIVDPVDIYFAICAACLTLASYALAMLNYSWKKPFPLKQITLIAVYIGLFVITFIVWMPLLLYFSQ